jgi:phospholipid/cholesterol/gamma-HCH transport system substrate-binding protein
MARVSRIARRLLRSRLLGVALGAAVLGGGAVLAASWLEGTPTYQVEARFASAQGVFPGAPVSLLGVKVGSVRQVQFQGTSVLVTIDVASSQPLPAGVDAQLVEPELLGEPDIELSPGYAGGATLEPGAVIPEDRTEVPATTDQLLDQLERVLGAIQPSSARQLVESLAADLQGEGAKLNSLLGNAAATVSLLASKGDDLGRLDGELASITGTLRSHESELADLVTAYDTVSAVLVSHQQALGDSITQLADASEELAGFLSPNLRPIEHDVAVITTVGRTLDRNLSSLDEAVDASASLFAAAHRAYDPVENWLDLNDQLAPGMSAEVVEGLVRDRLAGVCRRVLAHHSSGLDAQALGTLASCGNPDSDYFDPILGLIGRVLEGLPGGVPSGLPSLSQAVGTIPGLTPAQRSDIAKTFAAPPAGGPAAALPAAQKGHARHKVSLSALDKAIDAVLGALPPASGLLGGSTGPTGASGTTGATGTTGSGGLGGLLGGSGSAAGAGSPSSWATPGGLTSYIDAFIEGGA